MQGDNKVLDFIEKVHRFESGNRLFEQEADGLKYWDIVRYRVLERLFYGYYVNDTYYTNRQPVRESSSLRRKISKTLRWIWWFLVNEINFYLLSSRKKWLFLKISRFYHPETGQSYDAVAAEIHDFLRQDSLVVETFKNKQTDVIRFGHSYQTFHLYTFRNLYRKLKFKQGKTYPVSALLKEAFPLAKGEDWDAIIQGAMLEFKAERIFARRLFKRYKPYGMFFTGGAKGFVKAARELGVKTIEIQHSPLNKADIYYSYAENVDYSNIHTIPEYLLVNSALWKERIHYPPEFITVGSDYFFNSSKPVDAAKKRNKILFVSDNLNHDLIRESILRLLSANDLSQYELVFKLHSTETDRYEEAVQVFKAHGNVEVILNQKNISQLLDESCVTFIVYSTVAYQALQKGVKVILLKTGYYEGGYDIFEIPSVTLIEVDEMINFDKLSSGEKENQETLLFFEPFQPGAFEDFITALQKQDHG